MNGWGVFFIILVLFILGAYGGWVFWSRRRAASLGLPPPSLIPFKRNSSTPSLPAPRTGGLVGWVNDKIRAFKNRRYAAGAYEEGRSAGMPRGAGNRLDPDEAWDTRVGNEAYYEEQELGLHAPTAYGGSGYGAPPPPAAESSPYVNEPERGRSRTRGFDAGYEQDLSVNRERTPVSANNPFDDHAEPSNLSLRGVSPRPLDTETARKQGGKSTENSPTERRSMFRENM